MVWSILSIAVSVSAGLCLFIFIFQRLFICMPAPARVEHDAMIPLEVPEARLSRHHSRLRHRSHR
jgi:hypothetical protein